MIGLPIVFLVNSSHPTMGAWIEICLTIANFSEMVSHPTMGAWIEIIKSVAISGVMLSHPTMGAWIEIPLIMSATKFMTVAPHDGCVD